jgi:hypothetical protein
MRMLRPLLFCALAALAPFAGAAPGRDLGDGLAYYRVHELPADLPSPPAGGPGACVVDLRFARSGDMAAGAFRAWVKFNATARAPIFILVNSGTAAALRSEFKGLGQAGLVVIAPRGEGLASDVSVQVRPEEDRRAYDALDKGTDAAALLSDYPDKPRVDEAYLEKEHISDSESPDPETDLPAPPRPLVDLVLQRAVQIHRGLRALRRV